LQSPSTGQSHRRVTAGTPTRRGPTFVCARRRGLCSISGCYPYGIDNPPTLRRSSFPQGAPYQNALGAVPQDPLTLKLRLDTLSRCLRRILCGGTCKPIAGNHAAEPMGWISSYLDRRPLPRHGGGVGGRGRCACGYFWSVSVRSTDLDFSFKKNLNSYPALQATERGLSRGNLSPLTVFCLLLHEQK